jgi:hypothetical protein
MKIIAITKTFRGHEFAISSLRSIYNYVDNIIYVHSNISWIGEKGNTVAPLIDAWTKANDSSNKIIQINNDSQDQTEQYELAWEHAKSIPHGFKLLIDTDEVWGDAEMRFAIDTMGKNAHSEVFSVRLWSYLKSPFYRIDDKLCPIAFVRNGVPYCPVRCAGNQNRSLIDVRLHHFCSVRNSLDLVWQKHVHSCTVENDAMVPKAVWVRGVWNQLPRAKNLLPLANFRGNWPSAEVIGIDALPEVLKENALVKSFLAYPHPKVPATKLPQPEKPVQTKPKVAPFVPEKKAFAPIVHYSGSCCIATMVDKNYEPYAPLFAYCAKKAYPEYEVKVIVRNSDEHPSSPYATAAMRFLSMEDELSVFDYVLIQDVDMLIFRESLSIVDQHMMHLTRDNTQCYENWITQWRDGNPRMPGVHFVTKEWWARTARARKDELQQLREMDEIPYDHDEFMLGRIVQKSSLPLPSQTTKLWRHHGVHLGDWRLNMARPGFTPRPDANQMLFIQQALRDEAFLDIADQCAKRIPFVGEVIKSWPMLFRG